MIDFQEKKEEENEGVVVMLQQDYQDQNDDFKEIMNKYYQGNDDYTHKKNVDSV